MCSADRQVYKDLYVREQRKLHRLILLRKGGNLTRLPWTIIYEPLSTLAAGIMVPDRGMH